MLAGEATRILLVVDDVPILCRAIWRKVFPPPWRIEQVMTLLAARAFVERRAGETLGAVLLDYKLPDGAGTSLLPAIQRCHPQAHVAIYSGFFTREIHAEARRFSVDYIVKEDLWRDLETFARRVEEKADAAIEHAWRSVAVWADQIGLTDKQAEALFLLLFMDSRKDVARELRIKPSSIKDRLEYVLDAAGYRTVASLAGDLRASIFYPGLRRWLDARRQAGLRLVSPASSPVHPRRG